MKKWVIILLTVAVIGALILGGCTKKTTTTTTTTQTQTSTSTSTSTKTTTTTVTTPHKVLKIGSVMGLNVPMYIESKKWYELFAKLINEQGGWKIGADTYDIEMIFYDSSNDPVVAKQYLEKLVLQDGVKIILNSPTNNPGTDIEVTEPNKVICLGLDPIGNSADPKIQYYWTPVGMTFTRGFMYVVDKDMAARGMKSYVSLKPDELFGHMSDGMVNSTWAVAAPSVKYLDTVFYDPTTTDYGPVATKIMSLNPDVIDCNFTNASGVYNALYDIGYKGSIIPNMVGPDVWQSIITHCGKAFVEGWESGLTDPRLFQKDPEMLSYIDAYTKEYGTFYSDGCPWVCNWFILKDAINATQSVDVEVLKAYLDNSDHAVKTISGYCQLFARPESGNLRTVSGEAADFVGVAKDGELIPLRPIAVKDHYLSSILSYGWVDVYKAYWEQYGYPTFPAGQESMLKFSDLGITGHD